MLVINYDKKVQEGSVTKCNCLKNEHITHNKINSGHVSLFDYSARFGPAGPPSGTTITISRNYLPCTTVTSLCRKTCFENLLVLMYLLPDGRIPVSVCDTAVNVYVLENV